MFFHGIDMFSTRLENKQIDWSSTTRAWGQRGVLTFRQSVTLHWRHASHPNSPWITHSQARYRGKKLNFDRRHWKVSWKLCREKMASQTAPVSLNTAIRACVRARGYGKLVWSWEQCCDSVGITPLGFISRVGYECVPNPSRVWQLFLSFLDHR